MRYPIVILFLISTTISFAQPEIITIWPDQLTDIANKYGADSYDLKSHYFQYIYLIEKNVLLKEERELLRTIENDAVLAYKNGEISDIEKDQLILESLKLENEINNITYDISMAENEVKSILNVNADIIPKTDSLEMYISFQLIELMQSQTNSLPDDSGLLAFLSKENGMLELSKYADNISFQRESMLPYANKIKKNAILKLKNEEIDKINYYYMLSEVFLIRETWIDLINTYNQKAIEIEKNYVEQ